MIFRSQMRGILVSDDDDGNILSREMKGAFGEGLIINCSSSCSNTERLNPRGTNPARRNLSYCALSRGVSRYTHMRNIPPVLSSDMYIRVCTDAHRDGILHSNAGQEAPAFLVLRPRVSTGDRFASSIPLFLSFVPEGPKRRARNKNNKKCFLPFRLYISHLALSSLSLSLCPSFSIHNLC